MDWDLIVRLGLFVAGFVWLTGRIETIYRKVIEIERMVKLMRGG
jgi:hypothetical protein